MTLSNFANIGEFVGGLGTMSALIYVALEFRTNTRAIKASSYLEITNGITSLTYAMACNGELCAFVDKTGFRLGSLESSADSLRWEAYAYTVFRNLDNIYVQSEFGTISLDAAHKLLNVAIIFNMQYPRIREYWWRAGGAFSKGFQAFVSEELKKLGLSGEIFHVAI